jgi:hypothetical protein
MKSMMLCLGIELKAHGRKKLSGNTVNKTMQGLPLRSPC